MAEETIQPVYLPEEPLTPREARLARTGEILRWGAVINGLGALVVLIIGIVAATNTNTDLFITITDLTFGGYGGPADTALIAVILLLLANVSALLVTMVGVLSQEFWSLVLIAATIMTNVALIVLYGFFPGVLAIGSAAYAGYVMFGEFSAMRMNPVALKELRERMRGARAFVVITIYLGLMSGFTVLLYLIQRGIIQNDGTAVTGELGRTLFRGVVGIELLLIVFIAPAFTAGAVSTERERKTYDLLQITLLSKASFIIGKLESALGYIVLLLLAAIPLQSITFLFGGVTESELILAFIILAVTAITLGTVGLYFSTTVDRTLAASVRAYTVAFAVIVGIPLLMSLFLNVFNNALAGTNTGIDNPTLEAAMIYLGAFVASINPVTAAHFSQQLLIDQQGLGFWNATLSSDGTMIPLASPWISFTIIYLVAAAVLVVLAVRRMLRAEA
jgi:ABC-2 type transport system permease protein